MDYEKGWREYFQGWGGLAGLEGEGEVESDVWCHIRSMQAG